MPRIVDHGVDRAEARASRRDRREASRLAGEIGRDRVQAFARARHVGKSCEPGRIAIDRRDRMPGREQGLGHDAPDSSGRAREKDRPRRHGLRSSRTSLAHVGGPV
jgi:hypothetical protein